MIGVWVLKVIIFLFICIFSWVCYVFIESFSSSSSVGSSGVFFSGGLTKLLINSVASFFLVLLIGPSPVG